MYVYVCICIYVLTSLFGLHVACIRPGALSDITVDRDRDTHVD